MGENGSSTHVIKPTHKYISFSQCLHIDKLWIAISFGLYVRLEKKHRTHPTDKMSNNKIHDAFEIDSRNVRRHMMTLIIVH